MTSTLPPDPPNFNGINYNSSFWSNATSTGLTYNQALKNFLAFPVAQGSETLQNTNVNGTLTLINTTSPSETYSQYIDPNPNLDMTLSTTQTAGGLTIRTPTNSFTMNPNTFNQNLVTPTPVTGAQLLNPINMNNFNILNMGQYSTAYTQSNNTNLDYVATCNYVNNMIVNGNGILDNANDWSATNTFQSYLNVGTVNTSNYYSQISQLANGALNINNQCPTANFPNTNFKCNNGSNVMTTYFSISPQELDSFTTLNMNNNQIINSGGVQIGGATANTYTQLIQGGSTFGINNLYPSSSSPQISLAVKNLSESLQGLTITSSGVNLNTLLNMNNNNITSVNQINGNGGNLNTTSNLYVAGVTNCNVLNGKTQNYVSLTNSPPIEDDSNKIATTTFVQQLTGNAVITKFNATSGTTNSSFVGNASIASGSLVAYGSCSFINTPITIQMNVPITSTTILAVVTFSTLPWATWSKPYPSSLSIPTTCLNGSSAGVVVNSTATLPSTANPPYIFSIIASLTFNGLPAGTQFSFNLQNIIQAPFSIN